MLPDNFILVNKDFQTLSSSAALTKNSQNVSGAACTDGNSIWKKYLHCSTYTELLNNFISSRLTVKSRDCNTFLDKAHTSDP